MSGERKLAGPSDAAGAAQMREAAQAPCVAGDGRIGGQGGGGVFGEEPVEDAGSVVYGIV